MTDKPEVTQADEKAAGRALADLAVEACTLAEAFARYRIAVEKPRDDVIEECAKVAEGQSSICWSLHNRRGKQASDNIAKDIRAMKGSKT